MKTNESERGGRREATQRWFTVTSFPVELFCWFLLNIFQRLFHFEINIMPSFLIRPTQFMELPSTKNIFPSLSPYKKAAPYLGVTVKVIYLWSYLREAACVIVMTANISIEDYWSMNKINWTELLHQIMTHWNTLQASGKKITSPMSISAKGRVKKFMLRKLVDFSIKLVSPLRKMVLCE